MIIVGADDPSTTPEKAREIQELIAGSRLTVLPEAAHLANIEQEALFDAAVVAFLQAQ